MSFMDRIRALQNQVREAQPDVSSPPDRHPGRHADPAGVPAPSRDASLADDIIRGLRHLLLKGDFKINTPDAEVFVGQAATVVATPPVLRVTIAHLRRTEPTNRRLWALPVNREGPAFSALRAKDWLLAPPQRSVLRATVHRPATRAVELTSFNALVIKNDVLWAGVTRPRPFQGGIVFADLRDQSKLFPIADFASGQT